MQISRGELKRKIREWDNITWHEDMKYRSTLVLYREAKLKLGYEGCYSNNRALAKARTNSLEVEELYGRGEKWKKL